MHDKIDFLGLAELESVPFSEGLVTRSYRGW